MKAPMKAPMKPVDVPPFFAIEVSRLAHSLAPALAAQGKSLLHMEFGQPSAGAPQAALAAAQAALSGSDFSGREMGYWTSDRLYDRLARHYCDTYGLSIPPERFILTSGASGALVLAFTGLFQRGDVIAMTRPGYAPYRNAILALGLTPLEITCGPESRYQFTPDVVRALPQDVKAIIIASPANPTGTMISAADLREICAICDARDILVISDEIYHGLSYGPKAHSALEFTERAIVINSFSKYYCMPGWRLGWMIAPAAWAQALDDLGGNLFLTPSSIAQHAALAAMDARDELDRHITAYTHNRTHIMTEFARLGIADIAPPDGAFYIYADVGHLTNDSMAFCKDLVRETGLTIAPGIDFDPDNGQRFIRLSFAVSEAECIDAMERFAGFVKERA